MPGGRHLGMCYYEVMDVVFDVGGSKTRVGVSREPGKIDEIAEAKTEGDYKSGVKTLVDLGLKLANGELIERAAGGVAGMWNSDKSELLRSPNLSGWEHKPIKKDLEKAWRTRLTLENDAALGAVGEAVYGAGVEERIVAYLAIGTGVGGARVVDKRIDANVFGYEPGQQIVQIPGKTLEDLIGGRSIEVRFGKRPEEMDDKAVWQEWLGNLAAGIINITLMWSPGLVVLGGAMADRVDWGSLRVEVSKRLKMTPWVPKIVKARLGHRAGLWGGLARLEQER